MNIPYFIKSRSLRRFTKKYLDSAHDGYGYVDEDFGNLEESQNIPLMEQTELVKEYKEAELVTSQSLLDKDMHYPVIDIDFMCHLEPSSTEGHFHFYINKQIPWDKYEKLLKVLAECEIIEPGYCGASTERKFTSVRKPGLKKGDIDGIL